MPSILRTLLPCCLALTLFLNAGAQSRTITVDFGKSGVLISPTYTTNLVVEKFAGLSAWSNNLDPNYELEYELEIAGRWSGWKKFRKFEEEISSTRRVFEADPIPFNFHAIRFRANQPAGIVHFHLFYPKNSSAVTEKPMPLIADGACSCELPEICGRECWCPSGDCPKDPTPTSTIPDHFIIHHSAGFNSSGDYKAVVAYYWDFHTKTNGWDDIGYNWLIDPNGVVYEGRGDKTVGAHFSCMNTQTLGICIIGDYSHEKPSPAALSSLENLLAALCCEYGIDPLAAGYHTSSQLNLPNIASHRDGNDSPAPNSCASGTECPGDSLYPMLQEIRMVTAAKSCLALGINKTEPDLFTLASNPGNTLELLVPVDGKYELAVFNGMGQEVYTASIEARAHCKTLVELYCANGIYLVKVSYNGQLNTLLWEKKSF